MKTTIKGLLLFSIMFIVFRSNHVNANAAYLPAPVSNQNQSDKCNPNYAVHYLVPCTIRIDGEGVHWDVNNPELYAGKHLIIIPYDRAHEWIEALDGDLIFGYDGPENVNDTEPAYTNMQAGTYYIRNTNSGTAANCDNIETNLNAIDWQYRAWLEFWASGEEACTYSNWHTISDASCTTNGVEEGECIYCHQKTRRSTPALGHDWHWKIDSTASCTQDGKKHEYCSRCQATQSWNTTWQNALGHDWHWVHDSALSCTTDYAGHKRCTRAEHDESRDGSKNLSRIVFQKAVGHHYEELISDDEATCTEDGHSHYQCTNIIDGHRCTATTSKFVVSATGHYITSDEVAKKPSVYENGVRTYFCEYCGKPVTEDEIPHRQFNAYIGDKRVVEIKRGDELVWNGSVGDVGTDGGKTTSDDIFSLIENNWYYKDSHY